jgi:hypothetical protein
MYSKRMGNLHGEDFLNDRFLLDYYLLEMRPRDRSRASAEVHKKVMKASC